jgi:hypothetical protein
MHIPYELSSFHLTALLTSEAAKVLVVAQHMQHTIEALLVLFSSFQR